MTELKPCPFCGETEIYTVRRKDERMVTFYYVGCEYCGAEVFGTTKAIAIEKWNSRPNTWHTGTPTEGEDYLVQYKNGGHDVLHFADLRWFAFNRGGVEWQKIPDSWVVAWQKITPFEEGEEVNG